MRNIQAVPPIEDVFTNSFSEWIIYRPEKPTGFLPVLARDHSVSVGQLSNILRGRRKTDKEWRRLVSRIIMHPCKSMIGLAPKSNPPTVHNLIVQVNSQTGTNRINNRSRPMDSTIISMNFSSISMVATLVLVVITAWYANSAAKMLGAMRTQVDSMREQSTLLLKNIQVSAWTSLLNAAGNPAGRNPIIKLRALVQQSEALESKHDLEERFGSGQTLE